MIVELANRSRSWWRRTTNLFREAMQSSERDMTVGRPSRLVILLAIPMMLEMSMESLFAIVDIFFVAKLGAAAIATVGLTEMLLTVLYAAAIGMTLSVTAMVSRRIGEKNPQAAAIVAGQSIWIAGILALIIGVIGGFHAPDLLRLMGAEPEVIATGSRYATIMLGGSATVFYLFLLNAVFRGAGDATIAMRSLWLANGINIVLDPCLIFGLGPFPEMGVTGAAVATTIGRGIAVLYQLWELGGHGGRIRVRLKHLKIVPSVMTSLLRLSIGGICQFMITVLSWIFLMRIIATFGSAAVAGYTIGLRVIEFVLLPAWGLGNAASTLVGQNLGAKQSQRAEESAWIATRYNFIFLSCVAVFFVLFAEPIIRLFTQEPAIVDVGVQCLRILSFGYPLYAVGMVLVQSINGAGDTFTPSILNLICFWLIMVPLAWWLAHCTPLGANGVIWAVVISESLLTLLVVPVFRRGKWKLREV